MNKLKILIENFIEKILLIYKSTKNLDEKMNGINDLLNSIIDYCIKKNIYFFINNNIKYTTICISFREYIIKFIKSIINNKNIIDCIENNNDNNDDYDNFSSINSLLLNKYKKQENINNKVSFRDNISLITDNTNNNDINDNKNNKKYNVTHVKLPDDPSNLSLNYKSSLYIIILLDQNELIENSENSENSNTNLFLQNFIDKLEDLCKELCNANDKKNFTKFFAS